jgi:leukotriene-A4 hydrolase
LLVKPLSTSIRLLRIALTTIMIVSMLSLTCLVLPCLCVCSSACLVLQCEAIHARSLFPCQDTPAVKTPYSATVRAPSWCIALMSALQQGEGSCAGDIRTVQWSQPVPVPSYLVALAAGELESREISPRVKIWAEPSVVEAAAFEFSETEAFLTTAESLTLPYVWGRYDVLCLPPSFPYGGMENPCLTFATPTLLAGDKSLADVIAHEIAHSWTGNLVTNVTWEHFWLNEGWTMWLQRKIMARVKKNNNNLKLCAQIGYKCLEDDTALFGAENKFTQLVWPLTGEDPDEAFSGIPYEKGFNLLYYLESLVGSAEFEAFAKEYLNHFKYKTVSSGEFREYFCTHFDSVSAVKQLKWDNLFYSKGMPEHVPDFTNPLSESAVYLAEKWISWSTKSEVPWGVSENDLEGWSSQQKCVFFETLLKHSQQVEPLSLEILSRLDLAYQFTSCNNSELKYRWQLLCLLSEADWILPHVVAFITSQGRMKFVRPLYRSLHNSRVGVTAARETFEANHEMYHPIAKKMIASDLGINLAKLTNACDDSRSDEGRDASSVRAASAPSTKTDNDSGAAVVEEEASSLDLLVPMVIGAVSVAAVVAFKLLKRR